MSNAIPDDVTQLLDEGSTGAWRLTRHGGRVAAVLLLLMWVAGQITGPQPVQTLRTAWFDFYQFVLPRERESGPVIVVEIDEKSLAILGQWPWPRTLLATLVDRIQSGKPAAIGIDLLFPEPDRMSAAQIAEHLPIQDAGLAQRLKQLPGNDAIFARAIGAAPVVLTMAGVEAKTHTGAYTPVRQRGGDALSFVPHYSAALRSIPELDAVARGHAILSSEFERGVMRRMPMLAAVGESLVPSLGIELLRVAANEPAVTVTSDSRGVKSVGVGDVVVPVQNDGRLWVHFSPRDGSRFISASDVVSGSTDVAQFAGKLVLVGVTGIGMVDYPATPLGERMPGIEIHAQVLENIFDGKMLARPRWASSAEAAALILPGLLIIFFVPVLRPRWSVAFAVAGILVLGFAGFAAYAGARLLFDAALPALGLALVFTTMLAATLSEADAQRRMLRARLLKEREAAARLAGELEAARRIQLGILPSASALRHDTRVDIFAHMEAATIVGGDLYDFFMLDGDRLFFLVGDVSGKGLPASIFMAVSKAICKCISGRYPGDIAATMREVNDQIGRENPESFFVTLFAGVLNLQTGQLNYCNAGHDAPYALRPGVANTRLEHGGGPPLCALEGFEYAAEEYAMVIGEILCVVTDGVTECMNLKHELFGNARLAQLLAVNPRDDVSPEGIGNSVKEAVRLFAAGAEPADDVTIFALRWNGPLH
jgi:CHASE2 domain-containing sensor protein